MSCGCCSSAGCGGHCGAVACGVRWWVAEASSCCCCCSQDYWPGSAGQSGGRSAEAYWAGPAAAAAGDEMVGALRPEIGPPSRAAAAVRSAATEDAATGTGSEAQWAFVVAFAGIP